MQKPKTRRSRTGKRRGEGSKREEVEVNEGEEDEDQVGDDGHDRCQENDDDGKGVELLEGEEAATVGGRGWHQGGGALPSPPLRGCECGGSGWWQWWGEP